MSEFPEALEDVKEYILYTERDDERLLGSEARDHYVLVSREKASLYLGLLHDMDGTLSIEELAAKWRIGYATAEKIVDLFRRQGLLKEKQQAKYTEISRLSSKLGIIKCTRLARMDPTFAKKVVICTMLILMVLSTANYIFYLQNFFTGTNCMQINESYFLGLLVSWCIMIPSFLFHELCHVVVARCFGLSPESIHIHLYMLFFPLFYVKIPNMYSVSRRRRVIIMLAGIFGNILLANIMLVFYALTKQSFFLTSTLSQIYIIIANLSLFNLSDGYFVFCQLFKVQNLRSHMFRLLTRGNKSNVPISVHIYALCNFLLILLGCIYTAYYLFNILNQITQLALNVHVFCFVVSTLLAIGYLVIIRVRFSGETCKDDHLTVTRRDGS